MKNVKVLSKANYKVAIEGGSITGSLVEVIGEQKVEFEGRVLDQYLYNIQGYTPKNGLPFASLKANITLFDTPIIEEVNYESMTRAELIQTMKEQHVKGWYRIYNKADMIMALTK